MTRVSGYPSPVQFYWQMGNFAMGLLEILRCALLWIELTHGFTMSDAIPFIQTTQNLESFCAAIPQDSFITIDTEFMREKTYYSILCLIQIATPDTAVLIDPLAPGISLEPLTPLLNNPRILKVFHSGRQDLEIFLNLFGTLPQSIFDTQIAGMVCGLGDSVSYENLVKDVLKQQVDKSARFTNWAQRPLSDKQLKYALSDVTYLRPIYEYLDAFLKKLNRYSWIADELAQLSDLATYAPNPLKQLGKVSLRSSQPSVLARAYQLILWREEQAQKADKPRQTILADDTLAALALQNPTTPEAFAGVRGLWERHKKPDYMNDILAALAKGNATPRDKCPQLTSTSTSSDGPVDPLTLELLKLLLRFICQKENVADRMVASPKDLSALIRQGKAASVPCLTGWRAQLFGHRALDLLDEKLGFSIKKGKVVLETLDTLR
jgi:ribonuclease D